MSTRCVCAQHFVCTFTRYEPHIATCTLTFEEPARPEGPAWVRLRFRDFALADGEALLPFLLQNPHPPHRAPYHSAQVASVLRRRLPSSAPTSMMR